MITRSVRAKRFITSVLSCLLLFAASCNKRDPITGTPGTGTPGAGGNGNPADVTLVSTAVCEDEVAPPSEYRIQRTIHADVVAIDQPFMINRLGASQPAGMIFVLKGDLVAKRAGKLGPDNFKLREGKRPRPIVLRANVGDALEIHFENWLQSLLKPGTNPPEPLASGEGDTDTKKLAQLNFFRQATRYCGIHVAGMEVVGSIDSDGSWVGINPGDTGSLVKPGGSTTYRLYARETGTFLLTSAADTTVHQLNAGLFGAVNVQPEGAEWYRSQTTRCDMRAATLEKSELRKHEMATDDQFFGSAKETGNVLQDVEDEEAPSKKTARVADDPNSYPRGSDVGRTKERIIISREGGQATAEQDVYNEGGRLYSETHQPLINYWAVFKKGDDCPGSKPGKPILSMLQVDKKEGAQEQEQDLPEKNYNTEIRRLDNGFITSELRSLFRNKFNIPLNRYASVARVANENKYSWVVTNPSKTLGESGKTYWLWGDENTIKLHVVECELHLVHSDLTAIITGPNAGAFPVSQDSPDFYTNPASPDRRQPYREFTIIYHQGGNVVQAFPQWTNNNLFRMISAGLDQFGINYGFAAIGPEIVANRLGVGPMGNAAQAKSEHPTNQPNDAVELKYEEFFLSSWCVGDPAMIVDVPSNVNNQMVSNPDGSDNKKNPGGGDEIIGKVESDPVQYDSFGELEAARKDGPRPNKAFYPDDPSNVYHGYMRDHTKMRVLHAGPGPAHVHHLHAHQWLHSPDSPESTYLDSQLILPGSAYTLEITYNGSGNRNQTVGDSIFHCHFYPHFAKGMWSLWRVHDTFEEGTRLDENGICVTRVDDNGKPVSPITKDGKANPAYTKAKVVSNRALPDGEIASGTPTPAVIPVPTLGMAPLPAAVQVTDLAPWYEESVGMGRRIHVVPKNWKAILTKFDKDKDGKLDADERQAWYAYIDAARAYNTKHDLEYGDPGFVESTTAYNERYGLTQGDKGYLASSYNDDHNFKVDDPPEDKVGYKWVPYALYDNPGYPFFIPGVGGHRPPHPPMDMAWKEDPDGKKTRWDPEVIQSELGFEGDEWKDSVFNQPKWRVNEKGEWVQEYPQQYLDGGLPRHVVLGGDIVSQYQTRWDFTKEFVKPELDKDGKPVLDGDGEPKHVGRLYAYQLPETGTPVERAAMKANATRTQKSHTPRMGEPGNFILNGLPPTHGAPYADPSVNDDGNSTGVARRYQAAVIQTDVVLNKKGWHYPQQRFITLWEDVAATVDHSRPPEPFFIRTATGDATQLWHTNLVPNYYELDDFQVRTPTDVIGQHIHLVKFDVTASDGAANGWNYEDGTFGPTEVRDRIHAITKTGGLYGYDPRTGFVNVNSKQKKLKVWPVAQAYPPRGNVGNEEFGLFGKPPAGQDWNGAMTTIQRWAIDPLLNWQGHDRTLRTVFTHDHFGPSTHQQVGLYAGVLVEPEGSHWYLPDGQPMNVRKDGGPTSWQAIIITADPEDAHREYAIEFQDMQLAYTAESTVGPLGSNALFKPKLEGEALTKMLQKVPGYDGANDKAPAAFYVGQAGDKELANVGDRLGDLVTLANPAGVDPDDIKQAKDNWVKLLNSYGIVIDDNMEVTELYEGDVVNNVPTQVHALYLIQQPSTGINSGDYYIVQANNPQSINTTLPPSPKALSVFTPTIHPGFADPQYAVNPNPGSDRKQSGKFFGNLGTPSGDPQGDVVSDSKFGNGAPYPSLVSTRANGTYSMNYRNEPVQLRYRARNDVKPWNDLARIFTSPSGKFKAPMANQPTPGEGISPTTPKDPDGNPYYQFPPNLIPTNVPGGPQNTDPFTPLIRGYAGDDIQIRTLVGAHLQPHAFTIHGVNWLAQPSYMNSGYRNVQGMGLSEHFEMRFTMPSAAVPRKTGTDVKIPNGADYFYSGSTGNIGLSNGLWGIMRSYDSQVGNPPAAATDLTEEWPEPWNTEYLKPLLNNPLDELPKPFSYQAGYEDAPEQLQRDYTVHATTLGQWSVNLKVKDKDGNDVVLKDQPLKLVYNNRASNWIFDKTNNPNPPSVYADPDATIYLKDSDWKKLLETVEKSKKTPLSQDTYPEFEPLVLRANAGDWIKVTLVNNLDPEAPPFGQEYSVRYGNPFNDLPKLPVKDPSKPVPIIGEVPLPMSNRVGLHPQLVAFDVAKKNGINVGYNEDSTVGPGEPIEYYWYAGNISQQDGKTVATPVEFGATNLVGADLMLQTQFGMVGALVIEPQGASWDPDAGAIATINQTKEGPALFQECVLVMQNMVMNNTPGREKLANQTKGRQNGFGAVNYRTENFTARGVDAVADEGFARVFSNSQVNPADPKKGDPETPVFTATAGTPVRFRVIMPSTSSANSAAQPLVFRIHGHGWQSEPYAHKSTKIGNNPMTEFIGSQKVTVTQKYDIVLDSAGGPFGVPGDYLYQGYNQEQKIGVWGIFRVEKK